MDLINIKTLVDRLGADEAVRKMAAFQLQNQILDNTFARDFVAEGGLEKLKALISEAAGNTLAYGLTAFAKLLQVPDVQAEAFGMVDDWLIDRFIDLVIAHPLVNILRPATLILVILVSRRDPTNPLAPQTPSLAAVVAQQPTLAQVLVSRLTAADYALCANSLMLINAISRDAMKTDFKEWTRYVRIIYSYGANRNVSVLMYSTAMKDLTGPILDFQNLAKLLAKRWRDYAVDRKKKDCRKVLGLLQRAVSESAALPGESTSSTVPKDEEGGEEIAAHQHAGGDYEGEFDWSKLGFETNDPTAEINGMGFLGLLDFASFVQRDTESFNKMVLEQLAKPNHLRCPIAKTSVAVTSLLYDQFSLSSAVDTPAQISSPLTDNERILDPDEVFQPLYLQWLRIHSAAVKSFLRLWRDTGAEGPDDFPKVVELVGVLIKRTVKRGTRNLEIYDVEKDMDLQSTDWKTLRREQMDAREVAQQEEWGEPLKLLAERLNREAEEFIKEQRVSCLLQGEWFDNSTGPLAVRDGITRRGSVDKEGNVTPTSLDPKRGVLPLGRGGRWRYVRLKGDRKTLCWGDFEVKREGRKVRLDELNEQVDLTKVAQISFTTPTALTGASAPEEKPAAISLGVPPSKNKTVNPKQEKEKTPISITLLPQSTQEGIIAHPLLTLYPTSKTTAVEWRDGLRFLVGLPPGNETEAFTKRLADVGVRVKLLDIVAGGVEIPTTKPVIEGASTAPGGQGKVAITGEFWYDSMVD